MSFSEQDPVCSEKQAPGDHLACETRDVNDTTLLDCCHNAQHCPGRIVTYWYVVCHHIICQKWTIHLLRIWSSHAKKHLSDNKKIMLVVVVVVVE